MPHCHALSDPLAPEDAVEAVLKRRSRLPSERTLPALTRREVEEDIAVAILPLQNQWSAETERTAPTFKVEVRREMAWWTTIEAGPYRLIAHLFNRPPHWPRVKIARCFLAVGSFGAYVVRRRPKDSPGEVRRSDERHLSAVPAEESAMR